jgi:hypothetical protein
MRRWTVGTMLPIAWVFALVGMLFPVGAVNGQDPPEDQEEAAEAVEEAEGQPSEQDAEAEEQVDDHRAPGRPEGKVRRARDDTKLVMKLHKEMLKEIELRDEQAEAINDLFEKHLEALRERAKEAGSKGDAESDRQQELQEQLAEARRAQDREKMQQVIAELRELRGAAPGGSGIHDDFRDAVLKELDEEQAGKFKELFRKIMMPGTQMRSAMRDLRVLQQAVHALDLSDEQTQAVRKHLAGMGEALGLAREGDTEGAERAIAQIREAVIGELDEEQAGRLEEAEAEAREEMERRRSERGVRGPGTRSGHWRRPGEDREGAEAAEEADTDDVGAHEEPDEPES